jgi:hypothetical protein
MTRSRGLAAQSRSMPRAPSSRRTVLLAGATGLVGCEILAGVLADSGVREVHTLARRELSMRHPKLAQHKVDFGALPSLPTVDEVYLALGTTIKVAGSSRGSSNRRNGGWSGRAAQQQRLGHVVDRHAVDGLALQRAAVRVAVEHRVHRVAQQGSSSRLLPRKGKISTGSPCTVPAIGE